MIEILGQMRVNDKKTGEILQKVEAIFTCEDCDSYERFCHAHGADIEEFLLSKIKERENGKESIVKIHLIELEENNEQEKIA